MQSTCSRCGGILTPGASVCSYCGTPVASAYPQQSGFPGSTPYGGQQPPIPEATQYGGYPPGAPTVMNSYSGPYAPAGQPPAYGAPPQAPFGPPPQASAYGPPAPTPPFGAPPQPFYGAPPQTSFGPPVQPFVLGAPPQAPAPKKSPVMLIGIFVAVVVVLAAGGYFLFGRGSNSLLGSSAPTAIPPLYQASLTSDPGGWECGPGTNCSFQNDGYHLQATDNHVFETLLTSHSFDNSVIEVNGIISQGTQQSAGLGIAFRVPKDNEMAGYGLLFFNDGTYVLVKWDSGGSATRLFDKTSASSFHQGLGQKNDLKVAINGSQFKIFVNGQQINEITDTTYSSGYMGLVVILQDTEAIFTNLAITKP